ncbi:MAG TPA: 4-alpha-glucanotransferase [Terriglobia bacterium]|nr:4-alpha-glucanotransferase [Terriglobia bacterium]
MGWRLDGLDGSEDGKFWMTGTEIQHGLARLGVDRFVLGIHASMFPSAGDWDTGFGAPLSPAGDRVLDFAAELGFNALQLGPSGIVSLVNLSPYDGTLFARNPWILGLEELGTPEFGALLEGADPGILPGRHPGEDHSVSPVRAARGVERALEYAYRRFVELRHVRPEDPFVAGLNVFRRQAADWLELNACFEALVSRVGGDSRHLRGALGDWFEPGPAGARRRHALRSSLGVEMEFSELTQYLAHTQHDEFRRRARARGLGVWGDMQVGISHRDHLQRPGAFAERWLLGAPPSRTNPDGQPWGYPLLDPSQWPDPESPARRLFAMRARKLLAEYDGLRIDHPHGLVCPWIYPALDPDPAAAVRRGARARESPDLPDPDLQAWAIPRLSDLNPRAANRYADNWVVSIDDDQETRFAALFDALMELSRQDGADGQGIAAEVLSTCPYPLERTLRRHGLGRFRVTQKVNVDDPHDVYRTDRVEPNDWVMLGTHDTPPVFALADRWVADGSMPRRAAYLADRLIADPLERSQATEYMASSPSALLTAMLADLFVSGARHVYVFVGDLFGETTPFNRAGIVHPDNWRLRLPPDFERAYSERIRDGRALDIAAAIRLALTRRLESPPACRGGA